ncbi:MAG: S9 family peptidase [Planctomycetes bacterium]|nr:S9 family peptidase [Planctomycetota bacterium]
MFMPAVPMFSRLALWLVVFEVLPGGYVKATDGGGASTVNAAASTKTDVDSKSKETDLNQFPLIPREVLFGNPERAQARLSPDGKWLSFMAPVDGVLNVWVAPVDDLSKAEPITKETSRPVPSHSWAYDNEHILYIQDKNGNENFHLYATNVKTRETRDLTPIEGVRAEIQEISHKSPGEILVGLNDRDPTLHDIWRINIKTGEKQLIEQNEGVAGYLTDDDYRVRMAFNYTPQGGQVWQLPEGEGAARTWKNFMEFGPEDAMTSGPAGFDKTGQTLYFEDSRNRNTAGLFAMNLKTSETKLLADDSRCDVGGVLAHPTEKNIEAVSFTYDRTEWKILDDAVAKDFEFLKKLEEGEILITSRTLDDTLWTVAYLLDDGPVKFYRYVRSPERKAHFLFNNRDDLDDYPLVKMHAPVVKSRDGLNLVCYLSLPPGTDPDGDGRPEKPMPMVLDVHGGPWARDSWGLNSSHQWLANRGYAVLSVNYRGSTGFGKDFINAANGEWSGKMHDDLLDAVKWAIAEKVAIQDKVAIMGGSYGGYATLVGLTFTPDVFACGVDIVGPSSLVTLLQNVPPYWMPFMPVMKVRVGDVDTEEGRAELLDRSPLTLVDRIKRPLLIAQGANDPRVTQLEADQIVEAMEEKSIPVTYLLYPDEGHGFRRPENSKSCNAVTEAFLAEQLGGRFEPVGKDFEGTTITVPAGADQVPGLKEAMEEAEADQKMEQPPKTNG